jgi:hypothetical protein
LFHRSYISSERGDGNQVLYSDSAALRAEDNDEEEDGGIADMAANNWALPVRRPRQFSINSNGSW